MAETVILAEQTLKGFSYSETYGAYKYDVNPAPFTLVESEVYVVRWDGEEYTCTAQSIEGLHGLLIGNASVYGGIGNDEPFLIGCSDVGVSYATYTNETSHTVAIYQVTADTGTVTGSDIILKDRNGKDIQYPGITSIKVKTVSGETAEFVDSSTIPEVVENLPIALYFTDGMDQTVTAPDGWVVKSAIIQKPETLVPENIAKDVHIAGISGTLITPTSEEKTVIPDFSGGDMVVTPSDGAMFSKLTVQTPENLLPSNIAEGVNIAGIIGKLASGGGAVIASGTISATQSSTFTVTHNMGVIPDIVIICSGSASAGNLAYAVGWSKAFATKASKSLAYNVFATYYTSSSAIKYSRSAYTITDTDSSLPIGNATETTFRIFAYSNILYSIKAKTEWIAIGGLA